MDINQKILDILVDTGLTKNESKIFTTLLDLGCATASDIAKKSKVQRTNVYDALDRMVKKGVASYIIKEETKFFKANNPEMLLDLLKEKQRRFKEVLPVLQLKSNLSESKVQASVLEGMKGIKYVTDDILLTLNQGDSFVCWGLPKDTAHRMRHFVSQFHKKRLEKEITQFHIYNEDAGERIEYLNTLPFTHVGYLDKEYDSPSSTIVYGGKISLWIWTEEPRAIIIECPTMAEAYRGYFDILWKMAHKSHVKKQDIAPDNYQKK
ncbi:MAG: hypothetical protein KKG59_00060 [Nanoarchaeota archaeon]|nr:hypothetical protein [Nanoarchaeota archaeon]